MDTKEYTPEDIKTLKPNEVFVFGSNYSGIHGKGAAKFAADNFGAKRGKGVGLFGQSYALPTRGYWDRLKRTFDPISLDKVQERIFEFLSFAHSRPDLKFYVTKIGCGYAGWKEHEISRLFGLFDIPPNVILPREFSHNV